MSKEGDRKREERNGSDVSMPSRFQDSCLLHSHSTTTVGLCLQYLDFPLTTGVAMALFSPGKGTTGMLQQLEIPWNTKLPTPSPPYKMVLTVRGVGISHFLAPSFRVQGWGCSTMPWWRGITAPNFPWGESQTQRCLTCRVCALISESRSHEHKVVYKSFALASRISAWQHLPLLMHSAHWITHICANRTALAPGICSKILGGPRHAAYSESTTGNSQCHRDSSLGIKVTLDMVLLRTSRALRACI